MVDIFLEFPGGRGVTASSLKWKIRRGGGVLYKIPSVVGVWIFSGTTHSPFLFGPPYWNTTSIQSLSFKIVTPRIFQKN